MERPSNFRRPGSWTAVPSHIASDRHYMNCSLPARHMHLIGWLYCNRERTDGRLSQADFRKVAAEAQLSESEAGTAASGLVMAGLWERIPDGYHLLEFLKWNLNALEIQERKAENLARVHAFRADHKKGSPDPSKEPELQNTQNTQVRTRVRNALQDQTDGLPNTSEAVMQRDEITRRARELAEKWAS